MRSGTYLASLFMLVACSSSAGSPYTIGSEGELRRQQPAQGPFQPNAHLFVCNMQVANRPLTNTGGKVLNYNPIIMVNGIVMATAPSNDVCVSSGFGPRNGRVHKGLDLFARPAGTIYSAAPGEILEVSNQSGFGLQVLISHGRGVYSRYAHLDSFAPALAPGQKVGFGEPLGTMGKSGNATGIHLHYEILTGTYDTPKKSWGLTAHDPLDFPAYDGLNAGS